MVFPSTNNTSNGSVFLRYLSPAKNFVIVLERTYDAIKTYEAVHDVHGDAHA